MSARAIKQHRSVFGQRIQIVFVRVAHDVKFLVVPTESKHPIIVTQRRRLMMIIIDIWAVVFLQENLSTSGVCFENL